MIFPSRNDIRNRRIRNRDAKIIIYSPQLGYGNKKPSAIFSITEGSDHFVACGSACMGTF
jgi:hypothetical protein